MSSASRLVGIGRDHLIESQVYTANLCEGEIGRLVEENSDLRERIRRLEMLVAASSLASIRQDLEVDMEAHGLLPPPPPAVSLEGSIATLAFALAMQQQQQQQVGEGEGEKPVAADE
jgi:hypothetical protein